MRREVTWSQFCFCSSFLFLWLFYLKVIPLLESLFMNTECTGTFIQVEVSTCCWFFWFFVWPCDRLECVLDRGFVVKGSICFYNLSLSAESAAHVSMYQRFKNTLLLTTTKPLYKSNSNFGSCLQYPRVNQIPTLLQCQLTETTVCGV